jgi:hypothetical protein
MNFSCPTSLKKNPPAGGMRWVPHKSPHLGINVYVPIFWHGNNVLMVYELRLIRDFWHNATDSLSGAGRRPLDKTP